MEASFIKNKAQKMKLAGLMREDAQAWLASIPDNGFDREEAAKLIDEIFVSRDKNLPKICVSSRALQEKTEEALRALVAANNPPRIFRHGGGLARVELSESGEPIIVQLNESGIRGELARVADWYLISPKGDIGVTAPPLEVVRDFMTMPGGWQGIPVIVGITENPVIRTDGSVLDNKGYDQATGLYYFAHNEVEIKIPETITDDDLIAARELLFEVFCDFPFDSPISRTNILAALITPVVRPIVKGPTPLCCIDKPQVGSGASLIATVIATITTGRPAAMMTAPRDPDEWRKTITSALMQGRGIVVIDNLEGSLYDANLAAVLTATTFAARVLGTNEIRDVPNLATWIATGNNVLLGGDLPRRAYLVRIDAGLARPWLRDAAKFKHPELETWAAENRARILAAILTLARSWILKGKPQPEEMPRLGGYESWLRVVGGILNHAGIPKFLANLMELYERNDSETPAWAAFTSAWYSKFADNAVTGAELMQAISEDSEFEALIPIDPPHRDRKTGIIDDSGFTRKLGKALAARKGRIYPGENGDYKLDLVGISHSAKKWQITKVGEFDRSKLPGAEAKRVVREFDTTLNADAKLAFGSGVAEHSLNSPAERGLASTTKLPGNSPETLPDYPAGPCLCCGSDEYKLMPPGVDGKPYYVCEKCHTMAKGLI